MELKPVKKQSLSDSVFEQLRDQIVAGDMEPGMTLPSERALCDMLGVNRGAVREALKRLEQARLVSIQHGGATRVLDFRETAGTDLLAELLVRPDGQIDPKVARSIMEMRTAFGADMARRCASRGTHVADELDALADEMQTHRNDLSRLRELDMRFWEVVIEGSGNVAYQLAFNSIRDIHDRLGELFAKIVEDELVDADAHRLIARAIRKGEANDAEFYARDLVSRGELKIARLADILEEEPG